MIEYIGNAIKVTAGENTCIVAKASDAMGTQLAACMFCLFDDKEKLFMVDGVFNGSVWEFYVPAEATATLRGRYWYAVCDETDTSLCFKNPIYFM